MGRGGRGGPPRVAEAGFSVLQASTWSALAQLVKRSMCVGPRRGVLPVRPSRASARMQGRWACCSGALSNGKGPNLEKTARSEHFRVPSGPCGCHENISKRHSEALTCGFPNRAHGADVAQRAGMFGTVDFFQIHKARGGQACVGGGFQAVRHGESRAPSFACCELPAFLAGGGGIRYTPSLRFDRSGNANVAQSVEQRTRNA